MTTILRSLMGLMIGAAMATASFAVAQESGEKAKGDRPYPAFDKVDENDDKTVTWTEAKAAGIPKEEFQSADFDNDGELTRIGYRYTLNRAG